MPIIRSAKKKMRKDKARTARNSVLENKIKSLIKSLRKNPSVEIFQELTSRLDKTVKINLIHANKAARIKSRLSKLLSSPAKATSKPATKKTSKTKG